MNERHEHKSRSIPAAIMAMNFCSVALPSIGNKSLLSRLNFAAAPQLNAASMHLASFRAPDTHCLVLAARHNLGAVARYGDTAYKVGVPLEHLEHLQQ